MVTRKGTGRDQTSLVLLMWVRSLHPFYSRLSKNIIREIGDYYSHFLLPCIYNNQLIVYNVKSRLPVAIKSPFNSAYQFCLADQETAFCFDTEVSREVQALDLLTCSFTPLSLMKVARKYAEIIHFEGVLYVFGGLEGFTYIRSCEKLDRLEGKWGNLQGVNCPRHSACPCEYKHEIYLPPLYSFESMEIFTIETGFFRILRLGGISFLSWTAAFSYIYKEELVIVTSTGEVVRWKGEESEFRVKKVGERVGKVACAPVRCERAVVWFTDGQLMRLNCDTFKLDPN